MNTRQPFAMNAGPRLTVRFLTHWQSYFREDVASFPRRMAMALVDRGIAEGVTIAEPGVAMPEGAAWAMRPPGVLPLRQGRDEEVVDL
jgi:hypothetical protein